MRDAGKFCKHLLFVAVAIATLLLGTLAWAADRVVVIHAEGDGADAIARDVKAQLPKGLTAGDAKAFNAALAQQGHKGAMGKALDGPKSREKLLERTRKAADKIGADAVVIVRVKKGKKERAVTILVVDPKSAALAREDEVTLPLKKSKDDSKPVVASIVPALEKFAPAPDAAAAAPAGGDAAATETKSEVDDDDKSGGDDKSDDDTDEPSEARKTSDFSRALFVIGAGLDLGIRNFQYHQPITTNLRAYRVFGAPTLALNLDLFPLAGSKGPLGGIGVTGSYAQALALQSAPQGGDKFQTRWNRWFVGLRYRIQLDDKGTHIAPVVGYGAENFTFSGLTGRLAAEAPAAKYTFVKVGVDGRFPLGPVAIMAGVGYLFASSPDGDTGLVSGRFPNMSVGGVDANVGLGVGIFRGFEARLGFRYSRFFYSMNPEPGDTYVAGGALDQLASIHIGAAYAY